MTPEVSRALVCSIGEHAKCDGNAPNEPAGAGNPCGCDCHAAEADRGTPDDEFVAQAQHYRAEHEATHGEAEQCGGPCIVLGLDDDGPFLDLASPEAAERLAALIDECYQRGLDAEEAAPFILAALREPGQ